jgi:putative hydrolase of the HAD superfamily
MPSPAQFTAAEQILGRYNTRIVPRTQEVSAAEIWSQILHAWSLDSTYLTVATEAFFDFFQQQMCAYPEAIPMLACLRERGVPTGILTDVPYGMPRAFVERDLDRANMAGLFDVLITSVEVGVRKPEAAGYLALAAHLGVAPGEMLYIGNEPKDVIGACRAGVVAALLDRNSDAGSHGQQFTITTLSRINEIVFASRYP